MACTGAPRDALAGSETAVDEPLCGKTPADQGSVWSPCSGRFKAERQPQKEEIHVKRQVKGETAEEMCGWRCALGRSCSMPNGCTPTGLWSWATHTGAGTRQGLQPISDPGKSRGKSLRSKKQQKEAVNTPDKSLLHCHPTKCTGMA